MDRVRIDLTNCYGIKKLTKEFDFTSTRAYALYAPNGVMKSSLAKTFQDASEQKDSADRIFPNRETVRIITDEQDRAIDGRSILVVLPYDPDLGVTEQTSTLLLDPRLKKEYDSLLRATADAKNVLLKAIRAQSGSKKDLEAEISSAIMPTPTEFDAALVRVKTEVEDQTDAPFSDVRYDKIFNEKVLKALNTKGLKDAIEDYAQRYNDLLAASTYFKKGTFDYYNAGQIARSLSDNGFFSARHTVSLNADTGSREIKGKEELEDLIAAEKAAILSDAALRKRFDEVARQLTRNVELRAFYEYVRDNGAVLSRLNNPDKLKQEVIKSYLKVHEELYEAWVSKQNAAKQRRKVLEEVAKSQRTQWERVIDIFNERFFVPFKLEAKNRTEVMLGRTSIIDLGFTYLDGEETATVGRSELLQSLSTGERKALYVLNVIFEIETRKKAEQETLVIVDDLADSFDYRNKYAIIQYLKEISDNPRFRMLVMTHNFDFFRTVESRFIGYPNCLMASKGEDGVEISRAAGIRNIFARDWRSHFFEDRRKKIAAIPFLRNLVEMTTGDEDPHYQQLTSMLHWNVGSENIRVGELDEIFRSICHIEATATEDPDRRVCDLVWEEADGCLADNGHANLENKIVLAIAIRLAAERYMVDRIADPTVLAAVVENQSRALTEEFRHRYSGEEAAIAILDRVLLMTPENIHVNSFMYEPIIDMSDDHLRRLYREVKGLR